MHTGDKPRSRAIALVVLHEQFSSFFVQSGLRVGVNQKAFHGHKNVPNAIGGFPILLQGVDTDFTCGSDIWVEKLGGKPTFRWCSRELFRKIESYPEITTGVRRSFGTLDDASHIEHILFARLNTNSFRRVLPELIDFSEEFLDSSTGGRHDRLRITIKCGALCARKR